MVIGNKRKYGSSKRGFEREELKEKSQGRMLIGKASKDSERRREEASLTLGMEVPICRRISP